MDSLRTVRDHISRYFIAVYGKDVFFRAPETFPNILERWMLSIGADEFEAAEKFIEKIEEHMKEKRLGTK